MAATKIPVVPASALQNLRRRKAGFQTPYTPGATLRSSTIISSTSSADIVPRLFPVVEIQIPAGIRTPAQTAHRSSKNNKATSYALGSKRGRNSDEEEEQREEKCTEQDNDEEVTPTPPESKVPACSAIPLAAKRTRAGPKGFPSSKDERPTGIPDRLLINLDIVFCGINPSMTSEGNKSHFSGRGNQFYSCLLHAELISPGTTFEHAPDLPRRFSLGLTDLVARATASVKEVSAYEKTQAVPGFLRKIVECRPRVVCFVSLGIGETVCKALQCQWAKPKAPREAKTRNKKSTSSSQTSNLIEWKSRPARPEKSKAKSPPSNENSHPQIEPVTTSGTVTETLFFALPSTSGANACSYNLADKKQLFAELHAQLQLIKHGSPDAPDTKRVLDTVR
ncbi:uracil-DNA glycosylase-like protein [Lentinula lateritia]|uniref:Uracil-DNA glycosylase-like protein n=1 Tax=Lentinula lateritia TaxID=40482 RepID=A0ABQ8V8D0_9AGAR|nr:uracil-DNA glycosylase-like protein [Lentinula lateritia]